MAERQLRLKARITVIVNAVLGFVVAYMVLHRVEPGLFSSSQHTIRGGTRGAELAAAFGGERLAGLVGLDARGSSPRMAERPARPPVGTHCGT